MDVQLLHYIYHFTGVDILDTQDAEVCVKLINLFGDFSKCMVRFDRLLLLFKLLSVNILGSLFSRYLDHCHIFSPRKVGMNSNRMLDVTKNSMTIFMI